MPQETERKIVFECNLNYSLNDEQGKLVSSGDAKIQLDEETLTLLPKFGETIYFSYRDILDITYPEYQIQMFLSSRESITLSQAGYSYEDCRRIISKLRNEMLLKDSLMNESVIFSGFSGEFEYMDEKGIKTIKGNCEPRIYETALVIVPEDGESLRIPFSDISDITEDDYSISIVTELGDKVTLSKMGSHFDTFKKSFSDTDTAIAQKVQMILKELAPQANSLALRKAGKFMREGKAAKRSEIESISAELWKSLESKINKSGIKEEYAFFNTLAKWEKTAIGIKRGLLGDLTGEYLWFLIPIFSENGKEPGNVIAMEAVTTDTKVTLDDMIEKEGTGGKATYFFRLMRRGNYNKGIPLDELKARTDQMIKMINRGMQDINFRREPIYLSEDKIVEPQYVKYYFALQKLPALKALRGLFIGRVIHRSIEQWKTDVTDLLKFNVSTEDDTLRWTKGE